jgi:hypothetical protein
LLQMHVHLRFVKTGPESSRIELALLRLTKGSTTIDKRGATRGWGIEVSPSLKTGRRASPLRFGSPVSAE